MVVAPACASPPAAVGAPTVRLRAAPPQTAAPSLEDGGPPPDGESWHCTAVVADCGGGGAGT
eukprot:gene47899-17278_t